MNNLYACAMLQELQVSKFYYIKDNSQLNEDFIKTYNGKANS